MSKNKLIIAAAGSGKTTHLVKEALSIKEGNVLITTFTEANEQEVRKKILKDRRYIPKHITVQTWFSFLLQHGVRPYQGNLDDDLFYQKIGFYLF
jgi:DNA helicase II / ATP-dependent DNA helicase PcrA